MQSVLKWLTGAALLPGLCSCAVSPRSTPSHPQRIMYQWDDDGGPGKVAVTLDLARQKATYTRGDRPIGWSYICTGKAGRATPAGDFRISEKLDLKYSGSFGWLEDADGNVTNADATAATRVPVGEVYVPAPMPHWMRLTATGVGMHGGVIPHPGFTASHGCIRLPMDFAERLYDAVEVGTPVRILAGEGPSWQDFSAPPPAYSNAIGY